MYNTSRFSYYLYLSVLYFVSSKQDLLFTCFCLFLCDDIPVNSKVRLDLQHKFADGLKFLIYIVEIPGSVLDTYPVYPERNIS